MNKEEKKSLHEPKKCEYHLCKEKADKLYKCDFCGGFFCKKHSYPKIPMLAGDASQEKNLDVKMFLEKEWRRENAHPCMPYGTDKLKEIKEEYGESYNKDLDRIKKHPIKEPKVFYPTFPKGHKIQVKHKIPIKSTVAIVILIIIGLYVYYNFETVSDTVNNMLLIFQPKPKCETNSIKAYESTASFGRDPYTYCKNTCNESYNSTIYSVIEPNETSKLTVCYCNVTSCDSSKSISLVEPPKVIPTCSDNTLYNQCSTNKPFYCLNGILTKNVSGCGCPVDEVAQGDSCISRFEVGPKNQTFNYVLRGTSSAITFTVYEGLNDYLAGLPRSYTCDPTCPTQSEMEITMVNDNVQEKYLNSLVDEIKSKTNNKDDEARIAISLVQHIPYDTNGFTTGNLNNKYPYEVVYSNTGVCSEKSRILAFMLKEFGYGVALFNYETESHMAVGIKCPSQYAYENTGYCFIETDDPSIITYSEGGYGSTGLIKLTSTPDVYVVSDGNSFDSVSEEYNDAQQWKMLEALGESSGGILSPSDYYTWQSLVNKYGIETTYSQVAPTVISTSTCIGQTCNGQCYNSCPVDSTFKCDTSGATCVPNNAIDCNGQYYTPCPVGYTFVCMPSGGICQ